MIKVDGKNVSKSTVVLTGGGTAGHVIPHLALLPCLRQNFSEIYYIGSTNPKEREIIEAEGIEFFPLECVKLRRGFSFKAISKNLGIPIGFYKSLKNAGRLLDELKPDVVFSKGGFVALPVVRAAKKRNIPVVAHESDASLGLANRLSVDCCTVVCTTFDIDKKFKTVGPIIRPKIFEGDANVVVKRHNLPIARNLLVLGGSLGAANINQAVHSTALELCENYNVIHVCGRGKTSDLKHKNYVQIEFVDDIENYLAWADIVVSRAGSNTLCELMALGKPTLFIPLATGRGDQIDNVGHVLRHNAGAVLYEKDLSPTTFLDSIEKVWQEKDVYKIGTTNFATDGASKVCYEILFATGRDFVIP
ncbi:MAG: UDP-N-acetylglucosamine--N-acetylmuramyl-(pentapeptide) pyrophosphoryl-undecaprenol N-acetylglucosamine transferase [Firmicutes bacterium]|nr:UDP-N-acetylglucosamine--N-acetylmuramyl-(pentapeptide) pyrophosphoryl-undecaprenol N-acetylglucosamine transferase [Bacillota bacterium]